MRKQVEIIVVSIESALVITVGSNVFFLNSNLNAHRIAYLSICLRFFFKIEIHQKKHAHCNYNNGYINISFKFCVKEIKQKH